MHSSTFDVATAAVSVRPHSKWFSNTKWNLCRVSSFAEQGQQEVPVHQTSTFLHPFAKDSDGFLILKGIWVEALVAFLCLPCTGDVLPQRYWNHIKLLVEGIHILPQQQVSPLQIIRAGEKNWITPKSSNIPISVSLKYLMPLPL